MCQETCASVGACSFTVHHTSAVESKLEHHPAVNHESSADVCMRRSGKTNYQIFKQNNVISNIQTLIGSRWTINVLVLTY